MQSPCPSTTTLTVRVTEQMGIHHSSGMVAPLRMGPSALRQLPNPFYLWSLLLLHPPAPRAWFAR